MKIAMIGHKRIPSREGGIEIVVEELATRLVEKGHVVDVYNRKGKNVLKIVAMVCIMIISVTGMVFAKDIGFYLFRLPFIKSIIIYFIFRMSSFFLLHCFYRLHRG